ncbi:MAG: hypothetical protein AAGA23_10315 [Pseudomonadota bacterium]
MGAALQWFLFGMFVWACCLVMSAVERRLSPQTAENADAGNIGKARRSPWWHFGLDQGLDDPEEPSAEKQTAMAEEIAQLKDRVATLEAIVTDRRYQWEDDLRGPSGKN